MLFLLYARTFPVIAQAEVKTILKSSGEKYKKLRTSIMFSFIISIVVNIGMWFERFVIIVTSLHRDYLPSSWTMFSPTFVDIGIFIGTIGFFFVLFLLYAITFPVIAQAEVKTILKSSGEKYKKLRDGNHD